MRASLLLSNPAGPDVALGFIDALANHNDGADP